MGTELRLSKVIPPWVEGTAHHNDPVKRTKKLYDIKTICSELAIILKEE